MSGDWSKWQVDINGQPIEVRYVNGRMELYSLAPVVKYSSTTTRALEVCSVCNGENVFPIEWEECDLEDGCAWTMKRRCPDCERVTTGRFTQVEAERFDNILVKNSESCARFLEKAERENMVDWVARFLYALEQDGVMPEDF